VGYERIEETQDPEKSIDRAMENYLKLGYSKEWINQRLKSIEIRKDLTDEWENRGVKRGQEFATLTDIITQAWSGKTVKEYKKFKELKKENLRDNMTNLELVLNMLAEATTTEISKEKKPATLDENKEIAKYEGARTQQMKELIDQIAVRCVMVVLFALHHLNVKAAQRFWNLYDTLPHFPNQARPHSPLSARLLLDV